jgi:hypothetical protein
MGHRYIDLPFENVDVAAIETGAAWVRSRIGVQAAAIDLKTGEIRHRLQLPATTLLNRGIRFSGGFLAANVERGEVRCLSVESGSLAWKRDGELRGATPAGFVLAVRRPSGGATLIEVGRDGSSRDLIDVPDAQYNLPPAIITPQHVWTVVGKKLVGIPLDGSSRKHISSVPLEIEEVGLIPWRDGVLVVETREERVG